MVENRSAPVFVHIVDLVMDTGNGADHPAYGGRRTGAGQHLSGD